MTTTTQMINTRDSTSNNNAKGYMNIDYCMEHTIRRPDIFEIYKRKYLQGLIKNKEKDEKEEEKQCDEAYLKPTSAAPYYYYKKELTYVAKPS